MGGRFILYPRDDEAFQTTLVTNYGLNAERVWLVTSSWITLLSDSPLDRLKPRSVLYRFLLTLVQDIYGTIKRFSALSHTLLTTCRIKDGVAVNSEFLEGFRDTPVFREYLHFYRTGDPHVLRFLLTFLTFAKKVAFINEDLQATALRSWLELEERLGKVEIPSWAANLRPIMDIVFQGWDLGQLLPSHGSGAVAEKGIRLADEKNSVLRAVSPCIATMYGGYGRRFADSIQPLFPLGDYTQIRRSSLVPSSRLKFVPKEYDKLRSICMEPVEKQYLQQGIRISYENHLTHSILARFVDIGDQSKNQAGSLFGSQTGRTATIDLSSASDSVLWDLIKIIYPPRVARHLCATRTSVVKLPDGSFHKLLKFSPMGSALCFPVQSTIYSVVCLLIGVAQAHGLDWKTPGVLDGLDISSLVREAFQDRPNRWTLDDLRYHPMQVYGDDIICDTRMVSNVVCALEELGFTVNHSKSFTDSDSPIRESCGSYHYAGYDVTPFRLKPKFEDRGGFSLTGLSGLVDQANQALDHGYLSLNTHLRRCCLRADLSDISKPRAADFHQIPFTVDGEGLSLKAFHPKNSHLKRSRWNSDYQRREFRVLGFVQRLEEAPDPCGAFDNYWFIRWQRTAKGRGPARSFIEVDHSRLGLNGYFTVKVDTQELGKRNIALPSLRRPQELRATMVWTVV